MLTKREEKIIRNRKNDYGACFLVFTGYLLLSVFTVFKFFKTEEGREEAIFCLALSGLLALLVMIYKIVSLRRIIVKLTSAAPK